MCESDVTDADRLFDSLQSASDKWDAIERGQSDAEAPVKPRNWLELQRQTELAGTATDGGAQSRGGLLDDVLCVECGQVWHPGRYAHCRFCHRKPAAATGFVLCVDCGERYHGIEFDACDACGGGLV